MTYLLFSGNKDEGLSEAAISTEGMLEQKEKLENHQLLKWESTFPGVPKELKNEMAELLKPLKIQSH